MAYATLLGVENLKSSPGQDSTVDQLWIVVPSCDAYQDLWQPFFSLMFRYWPDCPYPIALLSNSLQFDHHRITNISVGGDKSDWSGRLSRGLSQVPTQSILLILEDFFFRTKVDQSRVAEAVRNFETLNAKCLRLIPRPAPTDTSNPSGFAKLGTITVGTPYRVSTQAAIWNKAVLQELLQSGESIWSFELDGSERSAKFDTGFFGTTDHVLTYRHHVVEKGRWFPWSAREFAKQNIGCDFSRREVMTPSQALKWTIRKSLSWPKSFIPWSLRRSARKFINDSSIRGII